jgi:hypothetical protein
VTELTDRERAVILDALAAYSDRLREKGGWAIVPIARPAHFASIEPMTTAEVERLYAHLRAEWQPAQRGRPSTEATVAEVLRLLQKKKE